MGAVDDTVASKFAAISPYLDERQRRLWLAVEARSLGRGGITMVAGATASSRATVTRGIAELDAPQDAASAGRARRPGAGRKPLTETDPGLVEALETLVDPATRGDPMSPLRWTSKSTRTLAAELSAAGHRASSWVVGRLLKALGYRMQANAKVREGRQHPDRDAQFRYLAEQTRLFLDGGDPVVSVDTKKKELVGDFANRGREWQPSGQPERVRVHDFLDPELGKAIPYGVYDVGGNAGWVNVGRDHDTAAFAVESIRRWWRQMGRYDHPHARRLLICADCGGSNGNRNRLWKVELAAFAAEANLDVTVCHLPPGTSKWNKIEHRLFSHIAMNWRGRPLTSHEVVVETIAATTTTTGLKVNAAHDTDPYPPKTKVSDAALAAVPLTPHPFHGEWNYTIAGRP